MKKTVILAATALAIGGLMFFSFGAKADELVQGAKLPAVTANDQDGQAVELSAAGGQGWTLVYFYPKADTPGCTKQACSIRDSYASLTGKGIRVFGVSTDDEAAQKAFHEKYKLPFTLLADKDKKVLAAFGVPSTMGYAKRQAYLFRDGVLVWRDLEAATSEQAAEVLAAIQEIEGKATKG
ncbi:MAG: peroxiredoxin [Thermoanaerobaculia bacterium]